MENLIHYILNIFITLPQLPPDSTPILYSPKFMPSFKNEIKRTQSPTSAAYILRCVAVQGGGGCFKHCYFLLCYCSPMIQENVLCTCHMCTYLILHICKVKIDVYLHIMFMHMHAYIHKWCQTSYTNAHEVFFFSREILINEFTICF